MVVSVALVYLPGIEGYIVLPKLLVFQVCLAICLVGWLAKTGWGREVRFRSSPLNLPVLLLLGSALI